MYILAGSESSSATFHSLFRVSLASANLSAADMVASFLELFFAAMFVELEIVCAAVDPSVT